MTIKQQLLKPVAQQPVPLELFGQSFPAVRVAASRMGQYHQQVKALSAESDDRGLNLEAAKLVLESIVDEKGKAMAVTVQPEQLLDLYSTRDLQQAINRLMQFNFMAGDAEAAAKKD